MIWKALQAVVLFATAGVVFAKDVFNTIRLDVDTPIIIAVGLGITTMLINRSILSLTVMVLLVVMIKLPPETLASHNIDRSVLQAAAISLLFLPWIRNAVGRS